MSDATDQSQPDPEAPDQSELDQGARDRDKPDQGQSDQGTPDQSETAALRMELIFAPRSYQFIGVQEVLTRHVPGIRAGMVWAAMSVLSAQVVNTAPVTSLGQSYQPSTCGFTPDMVAVGSTGSGSTGSSSTGSSSSGG